MPVPVLIAGSGSEVALCDLTVRTDDGEGAAVELRGAFRWVCFQLVITAGSFSVGHSLKVYVQVANDGANWDDLLCFNTYDGTVPAKALQRVYLPYLPAAAEIADLQDRMIGAGTFANAVMGRRVRARWDFSHSGVDSATFQVVAFLRGGELG
jgi:hypothetical protein